MEKIKTEISGVTVHDNEIVSIYDLVEDEIFGQVRAHGRVQKHVEALVNYALQYGIDESRGPLITVEKMGDQLIVVGGNHRTSMWLELHERRPLEFPEAVEVAVVSFKNRSPALRRRFKLEQNNEPPVLRTSKEDLLKNIKSFLEEERETEVITTDVRARERVDYFVDKYGSGLGDTARRKIKNELYAECPEIPQASFRSAKEVRRLISKSDVIPWVSDAEPNGCHPIVVGYDTAFMARVGDAILKRREQPNIKIDVFICKKEISSSDAYASIDKMRKTVVEQVQKINEETNNLVRNVFFVAQKLEGSHPEKEKSFIKAILVNRGDQ